MRIRSFRIQGFRSLRDTQVPGLTEKVVFHGDNGSGKSNLFLALQMIFSAKEFKLSGTGTDDKEPTRVTPFWMGQIPNFSENFYMNRDLIEFEVRLLLNQEEISSFDEQIRNELNKPNHDYYNVLLKGKIEKEYEAGAITLLLMEINSEQAFIKTDSGIDYLPKSKASAEARQNFVDSVLDCFTNQVRVVPATRYLSTEGFDQSNILNPTAGQFKNWLHSMSLSRNGYNVYQQVRAWFKPFGGEISFQKIDDHLDLMAEDESSFRMNIHQKGSGIEQILVLLGYIASLDAAVVAVEEPELNLSFRNQDLIVTIISKLIEDKATFPHQLMLASHSDHIGSRADLKQYHVEKTGTETSVVKFTKIHRDDLFPRGRKKRIVVH